MGAEGALLDTSVRYLRTVALCSPLAPIFFAMDNYLRISGYVKTSMAINVFSQLLTLGLLTLFLLVFKMGVVGSALATSVGFCICAVLALLPFVFKKALLRFQRPKFSFAMLRQIVSCGSPVFLSNVSGRVTSILMNISLMALGGRVFGEGGGQTAVAIYAVLMYSSDLAWPLLYGIADSLAPALGFNWGARDFSRVKRIARTAYIGTAIVGLVSTSILFLFPDAIASWFVKAEDTRLLSESAHAIRLFCFAYLFRWFGVTTQSLLPAIGKPLAAMLVSVGTAFVFPIVLLGALWPFGLDGIWFNFVGVNILAAALSLVLAFRLLREIRKKERMT
jgi:Na+-driven multidrug efflux pump